MENDIPVVSTDDLIETLARLDDDAAFFGKGRDLQSANMNHQYTEKEKEILSSYDTQDYLPPHSRVVGRLNGQRELEAEEGDSEGRGKSPAEQRINQQFPPVGPTCR